MCCCGKETIKFNEAPAFSVTNPYILSAYRPQQTVNEAFVSLFALHNETLNIWTHLVSAVAVIGWLLYALGTSYEDGNPYDTIIVTCAFLSCLACYLFSTAYHLFKNLSESTFDILLTFDYSGIIIATLGLQCSCCYFCFYCYPTMRYVYPGISICLAVSTLLVLVQPNVAFFKLFYSNTTRVIVFAVFFFYGTIPLIHYGSMVVPLLSDTTPEASTILFQLVAAYLFFIIGGTIWVVKFPECLWVGKFDILANSHQWWHFSYSWYRNFFDCLFDC